MGGKAHGGRRVSREEGARIAEIVLNQIIATHARVLLCGSMRRGLPEVGDVDFVVLPLAEPEHQQAFEELLVKMFGLQKNGKAAKSGLVDGVQVDVLVAACPEAWGAAILHYTGSVASNTRLRALAKRKGWMLNEKGLFSETGARIAGETEEGIYEALGVKYAAPHER